VNLPFLFFLPSENTFGMHRLGVTRLDTLADDSAPNTGEFKDGTEARA